MHHLNWSAQNILCEIRGYHSAVCTVSSLLVCYVAPAVRVNNYRLSQGLFCCHFQGQAVYEAVANKIFPTHRKVIVFDVSVSNSGRSRFESGVFVRYVGFNVRLLVLWNQKTDIDDRFTVCQKYILLTIIRHDQQETCDLSYDLKTSRL